MNNNLKQYSDGNTVKLFSDNLISDANFLYSFDCVPLDLLFGGGIASGKIIEIFGPNSHGKSTLALEITKAFAAHWKAKKVNNFGILWAEAESALDKTRALYMGCPVDNFLVCEADTLESFKTTVLATLEKSIQNKMPLIIVLDTIAALQTENEAHPPIDKKTGKPNLYAGGMQEKPRVIWAMLRDLTPKLAKSNSTLILVNQIYGGSQYESPESPGGGGIKFYSSVRVGVNREKYITVTNKDGTEKTIGILSNLRTIKNKLTLPNQLVTVTIMGETGFDKLATTVNFLTAGKYIVNGSWKTLSFPVKNGYVDKSKKDEKSQPVTVPPEMEELKFQNINDLRAIIEMKHPQIKDWLDYLCYKHATTFSPLLKVKIIDKAWKYEEQFYGKRLTELTDKEREAAAVLHKINQDPSKDA